MSRVRWTALALLAACGGGGEAPQRSAPKVGVIETQVTERAAEVELRGRVEASRTAEVRARVTGVILERVFEEGDEVNEGDVLYRIDPAPMRAALDQAAAQVSVAEASLQLAEQTRARLEPLAGTRAVSAQTYDDAVAAVSQAKANLQLARATRTAAKLDLEYATVRAPISGRIGRALVTEGALVTASANTQLATIVQLDPVYVNLTVPVNQLRRYRMALRNGQLERTGETSSVQLFESDGWTYPHEGTVLFADVTVDPDTGSTLLRANVPNPDRDLLPGMYVRARVGGAAMERAVSVPKQAVSRGSEGDTVLVVSNAKAERRPVTVTGSDGTDWVVSDGLAAGEQVIVDGLQHVRDGQDVDAVEWNPLAANREE